MQNPTLPRAVVSIVFGIEDADDYNVYCKVYGDHQIARRVVIWE
jgi:hypothetical protein